MQIFIVVALVLVAAVAVSLRAIRLVRGFSPGSNQDCGCGRGKKCKRGDLP